MSTTLSPKVRALLTQRLGTKSAFLLALNAKANRTGTPVFTGIDPEERRRRRAAGKRQRAARKVNR